MSGGGSVQAAIQVDDGLVHLDAAGPGAEIVGPSVHPAELPMLLGGSVRAAFQVDHRDGLMGRGIEVGDIVNRQWGRYVELSDPENNPLVISQVAG